jgi:adenine-specific DNA-methyltransferase
MGTNKQKLELTWIGKENRPKLEPRILLEDPAKSYHAKHRVTDHDLFDNRLIFGDNLLALKALEAGYAGKVKCGSSIRPTTRAAPSPITMTEWSIRSGCR